MAEYVGFSINFDVAFSHDRCRTVFETLREAVRENWEAHRDPLSFPGPRNDDFIIDDLLERVTPERMQRYDWEDGVWFASGWITFAFGPLSTYAGLLTVFLRRTGSLGINLSVCDSEMRQDDAARLRRRQEYEPEFEDPRMLSESERASLDDSDFLDRWEAWDEENGRRHDQFYRDNHQVWDVSAACLRHIADRLAAALPVAEMQLDPELQPGGVRLRFGR